MHKYGFVLDLNIVSKVNEKCIGCQLNKCTSATHASRSSPSAKLAGNVLHIDTAGPMTQSLSGSKYMVFCKDEASNYRQVAFVVNKSQIADKVKEFGTRAILEMGNQVLKLVTDNGSEYVNSNIGRFLQDRAILHEKPVAPQQKGLIERNN